MPALLSRSSSPPSHPALQTLVGESPVFHSALALAERFITPEVNALLLSGAAGTGKELLARSMHAAGPHASEPFIAINCVEMPVALLDAELFGQEPGTTAAEAKRGLLELAGRGCVYLSEIDKLAPRLQPKLLKVFEERRFRRLGGVSEIPIGCHIIAASKVPLEAAVGKGEFRADLLLRLSTFEIKLAPLTQRGQDAGLLAQHFLSRLTDEERAPAKVLTPEAVEVLHRHAWPGNVRELKIVIERAALLTDGEEIGPEHLLIQHRFSRAATSGAEGSAGEIRIPPHGKSLEEIEREAIVLTLSLTGGNHSATARTLGISRPTLLRKLDRYGLRCRAGE